MQITHLPVRSSRSQFLGRGRNARPVYGGEVYYGDPYGPNMYDPNYRAPPPLPRTMTTLDPVNRPLNFTAGKYAIPYLLAVPESEMPSFTYAHPPTGAAFVVRCVI